MKGRGEFEIYFVDRAGASTFPLYANLRCQVMRDVRLIIFLQRPMPLKMSSRRNQMPAVW